MKKLISILLAAVMLFTLSAPTFAKSFVSITANPSFNELLGYDGNARVLENVDVSALTAEQLVRWKEFVATVEKRNTNSNMAAIIMYQFYTTRCGMLFYLLQKNTVSYMNPNIVGNMSSSYRIKASGTSCYFTAYFDVGKPIKVFYQPFYSTGAEFHSLSFTAKEQIVYNPQNLAIPCGDIINDVSQLKITEKPPEPVTRTLSVNYVFSDGTKAADSVTQSIAEGAAYNITSPVISGYTPDKAVVSGTMSNSDHTVTVTYSKNKHNLTVHYVYSNGTKAADSVTQSVEEGAAYNIPSPTIPGHTPDKAAVIGTMSGSDITATVTYAKNQHSLTVNYVYPDGTKAAESVSKTVGYGESYSISSPAITGYKPDKAIVSGSMPDKALTVTVTYGKNLYTLTVNYIYEDGSKAAETVTKSVAYQAAYSIFSPAITGYTPDKPTVTGIMKDSNLTAEVTYKRNTHSLKIDYFYANGLKAADSVSKTLGYNEAYNFPSPAISGYFADKPTVSGNMPDSDLTVKVTYSKELADYALTVQYVYQDGTTAADSAVTRYPANFLYQIESPAIEGYHPDTPLVSGKMPENDLTVTVTYIKDDSGGGGGDSGGGGDGGDSGGGGDGGDSGGGSGGGGDSSIFNPFIKPDTKPYEGFNPFVKPDTKPYEGLNPFVKPDIKPYEGLNPFVKPDTKPYEGINPFVKPPDLGGGYDAGKAFDFFMEKS